MGLIRATLAVLALGLTAFSAAAENRLPSGALTIDRQVEPEENISFPNERNIHPVPSDFRVISYILMSSEAGERWAAVTFENAANGQRVLNNNNVMALFANGDRRQPLEFNRKFEANERYTLTLNFGQRKFPVLTVYTQAGAP